MCPKGERKSRKETITPRYNIRRKGKQCPDQLQGEMRVHKTESSQVLKVTGTACGIKEGVPT